MWLVMSFSAMELAELFSEIRMALAQASLIPSLKNNLNHATKRVRNGTRSLVPFLTVMKSAELTLVVYSCKLTRKFMNSLALKTVKLKTCFGLM